METAARMEKWKNELHVFPLSHKRFHSSHSFYYWFMPKKREERM